MTVEDEDQWIGVESHLVPKVDAGEKCNSKTTVTIQGTDIVHADIWDRKSHLDKHKIIKGIDKHNDLSDIRENENRTYFVGYCGNVSGKGRDADDGRCEYHHAPGGTREGAGAPKHNQNGKKHTTNADPHHYAQSLPPEEEEFIEGVTATILDRVRRLHGREPDFLDKVLAKRVAISFHIASQASDYTKDEMVQVIMHDGSSHEEPGALVESVRRYGNSIFSNLKTLGVMEDPESQKADAVQEWRGFLEQNQSQDDSTT